MTGITMKTKLVLATCLPLLIGSIALLTNEYYDQRREALAEAREDLMQLAQIKACELDDFFNTIETQARQQAAEMSAKGMFTNKQDVNNLLVSSISVNPDVYISYMAFEPGLADNAPNGLYGPLYVRTAKGNLEQREIQNSYDYLAYDWYLIPKLTNEPCWGEPFIGTVGGEDKIICVYSVPFYWQHGFAGVTGVDVQLNELSKSLSQQKTIGGGYIGLISKEGTFMAHPYTNLIMNWSIFALAEWYGRNDLADLGHKMVAGESGIVRIPDYDIKKGKTERDINWLVYTPLKSNGWSLMMTIPEKFIIAQVTEAINRQIFYFSIGIAIIILITAGISIRIANRLKRMAQAADHIASGDLHAAAGSLDIINANQHCSRNNRDETKRLIASMDSMANRLDALVTQVQASADSINESSETIATQVNELEVSSTEQAASTNQVVASAKEIAATAQDLVGTMQAVLFSTQQTEQTASLGREDLEQMHQAMSNLQNQSSVIAEKLQVIHDKAENITCIITTIVQVADRTNLLSLNAAIEAQQAGEHGKGFAVVASEIRRLADQTAAATLHIERTVKEMITAVLTGVSEMSKFSEQVEDDVKVVGNVGKQMGQIIEDVQNLGPKFHTVQEGIGTQAVAASQISEAMAQISQGAQQNVAAINELNQIAQALHFSAESLNREVSSFKAKKN